MNEDKKTELMASRKNIVIGQARIIWATRDGYEPAWVLPGGIRTQDKHEATAYAVRLNRMLSGR
ncbi:hypothetical protein [Caldilinea sp.]|uniref:hypothetical protein n=1 Tax=Caldilinea sp. TaxID=2293560 RepID=UPI002B701128|nr:hypothetical protein [Caldilinea sp.]